MNFSNSRQTHSLLLIIGIVVGTALCGQAASTHQLTAPIESEIGGTPVALPAGTEVEVISSDGTTATVRHTLPDGAATLLFIPTDDLKALATPKTSSDTAPRQANPAPQPSPPSTKPETKGPEEVHLQTKDGKSFEGHILRLEKRYVVLQDASEKVEDIPLPELDEDSRRVLERWEFQNKGKPSRPDPRIQPGHKLSLFFPDLPASRSSDPTKIQIRIPENFRPDQPTPLALYLGGGSGTDNCDALKSLVDPSEWILVAFPYPKDTPKPLAAYEGGQTAPLIKFQEPMLERVQALLPNTDPARRVVVGTSNGAHMIAIAVCDGWDEFSDYFSAFVLHEGGGSESRNFRPLRRKDVFVLMGQNSKSLSFSEWVVSQMKRSRVKPDVHVSESEGHGMGNHSRAAIKEWIAKLPTK